MELFALAEYKELSLVKQSLLRQVDYLKDQTHLNAMVRLEHYSDDDNYDLVVLLFANDGALISDEVTHTFDTCQKEEAITMGKSLLRTVKTWLRNMDITVTNNLIEEEF